MRYSEITEHTSLPAATGTWLTPEAKTFLENGSVVGEISSMPLYKNQLCYGVISNNIIVAFFNIASTNNGYMLKRLEVSENMRGTGLSGEIVGYLLQEYSAIMSDDTMTKAAEKFFAKMLDVHHSGIIDSFTGKVYRLEDVGKEIEGNIILMSPERDNMNMDRRPDGKPVDRHDYVHRFYWILSSSPLSYEDI